MLKEDSPPADHIMALLMILPIKNTIGLLEQLKGVSYFARMVNCLPACSDTHLSLCHLLSFGFI